MSPPACPVLRELTSAVCTPQRRTATRGGDVGLGVCVAAARITPHIGFIYDASMAMKET